MAHIHGVPVGLREERHCSYRAVLLPIELLDGVDEAHCRLAPVDDGDAGEAAANHQDTAARSGSSNLGPIGVGRATLR